MTRLTIPALEAHAVLAAVRPPDRNIGPPESPDRDLEWDTDLSADELQTVADVRAVARTTRTLTAAEYAAVRPHIQTLRNFRQLGRNAFSGLTAAERDRMLYDAQVATMAVLLTLLRD